MTGPSGGWAVPRFDAADAGVAVRVAADACAGATDADHDRALAVLAPYAPLITVTTVDAVLG